MSAERAREKRAEFLARAPERMEQTMRSYLQVPIIRHAVRQPAPGQEREAGRSTYVRSFKQVKIARCG